jgi:hypothetical protein
MALMASDEEGHAHGSSQVDPWRVARTVGVTGPDLLRSGGRLTIAPGHLTCVQHRPFGDDVMVKHDGTVVDVYTAWLVPPWFNVTVPVRGKTGLLVASTWLPGRQSLMKVLRSAGFSVALHNTRTFRGFRWSDMPFDAK